MTSFDTIKKQRYAKVRRFSLGLLITLATGIGLGFPTAAATQDASVSLRQKYAKYFPIGAAIRSRTYVDDHVPLLRKHFNSVVCENEMKWEALQPRENVFRYVTSDRMIAFAEENKMAVRGHCLIWHKQTPAWVFLDSSNARLPKEVVLQKIKDHVTNVMTHFKGKVRWWDVVNEAFAGYTEDGEDAGEDMSQVASWRYRESLWYKICGEDYIFEAFRAARAADPDAKLFYNDFWNYLDGKRAAIIKMIKKLQAEKLIDGVGLQLHVNIEPARVKLTNQSAYQTIANLEKEIKAYAALGLEIQITEFDISMYTRDYPSDDKSKWYATEADIPDAMKDKLAARYKEFFDLFRRYSRYITNVTLWGIADDKTWLSEFSSRRPDYPLLFDKELKPKKAFFAITNF
ncbi:MAG: endo-1,4-beta-xylanase [Spirochaetales bacterium]|nr:endo-1,4-beta-xylanase [Spirochaetales bacterium]